MVCGVRPWFAGGGAGERFEGGREVESVHVCIPWSVGVDPLKLQPWGVRAVSVE